MDKRLRPLLLIMLFYRPLLASQALTTTGKNVLYGMGKASLVPLYIMQLPFAVAAEVFFNKKIGPPSTQPVPQIKNTQEHLPVSTSVRTTVQTAHPTVSLPHVLGEVMSGLPKDTTQPVFINVNVNTQQAALSAQSDASPQTPLKTPPTTPLLPATPVRPSAQQSWTKRQIATYALYGGCTLYIGLHLYLWSASLKLIKASNWSLWRSLCSLKDLYETNHHELLKSLMHTLEDAYQTNNDLHNAQRFLKDATSELALLGRYKGVIQSIDRWHLRRLFLVNRTVLETIPERIQRLEFLTSTITRWLKDHQQQYCYDSLFKSAAH